jgi:hypothetical protein
MGNINDHANDKEKIMTLNLGLNEQSLNDSLFDEEELFA